MKTSFSLNEVEQKRYEEFCEDVKKLYGECGIFKFTFTPTGIGDGIDVYSVLAKTSRDITDYDSW